MNDEKHCFLINTGVYHRTFSDIDLSTSKKPTRWGLMGLLGYQLKFNEKFSTGLHFRYFRDLIRNIDRDDQYKIQHLGLSIFMDINLSAVRDNLKRCLIKKSEEKNN